MERIFKATFILGLVVSMSITSQGFCLQAGVGKAVITNRIDGEHYPQFMGGFGYFRVSSGIHDELWTRCLLLRTDETTVAFITVDLVGLFRPDCLKFAKEIVSRGYDIEQDNIIIHSTHNHEGPDTMGLWGPSPLVTGVDPVYMEIVKQGVVAAFEEAYNNLQSARIRFGKAFIYEDMNYDTREPEVIDTEVPIMQLCALDGSIIATLESWGSHPEVLWDDNTIITADYPYYSNMYLENYFGGMGFHISSDLGGLMTPRTSGHTWEESERIGNTLAQLAIDAIENQPWIDDVEITLQKKIIDIPLQNPEFILLFELGVLNRELYDGKVRTEVNLIHIGDAIIFTVPGEMFPETGYLIKDLTDSEYEFIFGLANDELGYLVPEDQYDHREYEESVCVGPKAACVVQSAFNEMITGQKLGCLDDDNPENGCFIATATFGSPFAEQVILFKEFRDKVLNRGKTGKMLIKAYYRFSPSIANKISQNAYLKTASLLVLLPLSWVVKGWLEGWLGWMSALVLIFSAAVVIGSLKSKNTENRGRL